MRNAKQLLKRYLPGRLKNILIRIVIRYRNRGVFSYDKKRFRKSRFRSTDSATAAQLEAKMTFHAHSIEKGLSHDSIRLGFGVTALAELTQSMAAYDSMNGDKKSAPYLNALSVLREYIDLHKQHDYDLQYARDIVGSYFDQALTSKSKIGGAIDVYAKDKQNNKNINFKDIFLNRVSVREYADTPVDMTRVNDAIQLSMKSPSVCNRQSSRVHVLTDRSTIERVLREQRGIDGYQLPPVLLVVTTDSSSFLQDTERNQIWVDGGLYAMSLLLALEYEGLAACPLNAMLNVKRDKAIRKIVGLGDSENIIVFYSVGNFKEKTHAPKSFRLKGSDITREI